MCRMWHDVPFHQRTGLPQESHPHEVANEAAEDDLVPDPATIDDGVPLQATVVQQVAEAMARLGPARQTRSGRRAAATGVYTL